MKSFDSLVDAIEYYKTIGFKMDFNLAFDHLICSENMIRLQPSAFEIIEVIRFDASTDPGEESVLFVVQSMDGKLKGTLVSAYGTYADTVSKDLLDKLKLHHS